MKIKLLVFLLFATLFNFAACAGNSWEEKHFGNIAFSIPGSWYYYADDTDTMAAASDIEISDTMDNGDDMTVSLLISDASDYYDTIEDATADMYDTSIDSTINIEIISESKWTNDKIEGREIMCQMPANIMYIYFIEKDNKIYDLRLAFFGESLNNYEKIANQFRNSIK